LKSIKITKDFLGELKKYTGFGLDLGSSMLFKDECLGGIVPKELEHNNLLLKFSIDKSILKWYSKGSYSYDFFMDGNQETDISDEFDLYDKVLDPFPFKIFGAYYNRIGFFKAMNDVFNFKGEIEVDGNYELKNLKDLKPCFELYAKGFKQGYEDFESKCISPYLFNNESGGFTAKVFEYVTTFGAFRLGWTQHIPFISKYGGYKTLGGAFESGKYEGRFYRAWSIIFLQNILFAPLFQEYLINNKSDVIDKLTINQIALMYVYENRVVTRENCNSEIVKFGYTSGEKLYQKFTYYSSRVNRKGIPSNCTPKILENKIKLIEKVIKMLSNDCKKQAIAELNTLKTLANNKEY
jgi:hypothetical protein